MKKKNQQAIFWYVFDTITLVLAAMWGVPWCLYICIASKMGLLAQRDTRDTYYNAIVSTQLSCQTIHNLCQTFLIFCVDIKTVCILCFVFRIFSCFYWNIFTAYSVLGCEWIYCSYQTQMGWGHINKVKCFQFHKPCKNPNKQRENNCLCECWWNKKQ